MPTNASRTSTRIIASLSLLLPLFGLVGVACSSASNTPALTDPQGDDRDGSKAGRSSSDDDDGDDDDDESVRTDAGAEHETESDASTDAPSDSDTPELKCFDFSDDPDVPLALDGVFSTTTTRWVRPYDEPPVCPATGLLPSTAADVPHVVYAFCNRDKVAHTYTFEMISTEGPTNEPALDDPFLVLYSGVGIPTDPKQCLAINDDIPMTLTSDATIEEVTVPAGGAVTLVGTTVTYDPTDGTGQGYYILVATNADP